MLLERTVLPLARLIALVQTGDVIIDIIQSIGVTQLVRGVRYGLFALRWGRD